MTALGVHGTDLCIAVMAPPIGFGQAWNRWAVPYEYARRCHPFQEWR